MPIEMTEHVCEENIEESYESFDISESDLLKARPQPMPPSLAQKFLEHHLPQREEKSMIEKFNESFFNHESKVALNSDVDLIKTTKIPYIKQDMSAIDDKISGNIIKFNIFLLKTTFLTNFTFIDQLCVQLVLGFRKIQILI
jgi:hypothetical protein